MWACNSDNSSTQRLCLTDVQSDGFVYLGLHRESVCPINDAVVPLLRLAAADISRWPTFHRRKVAIGGWDGSALTLLIWARVPRRF